MRCILLLLSRFSIHSLSFYLDQMCVCVCARVLASLFVAHIVKWCGLVLSSHIQHICTFIHVGLYTMLLKSSGHICNGDEMTQANFCPVRLDFIATNERCMELDSMRSHFPNGKCSSRMWDKARMLACTRHLIGYTINWVIPRKKAITTTVSTCSVRTNATYRR